MAGDRTTARLSSQHAPAMDHYPQSADHSSTTAVSTATSCSRAQCAARLHQRCHDPRLGTESVRTTTAGALGAERSSCPHEDWSDRHTAVYWSSGRTRESMRTQGPVKPSTLPIMGIMLSKVVRLHTARRFCQLLAGGWTPEEAAKLAGGETRVLSTRRKRTPRQRPGGGGG